jgi:hypothetical protein
MKHIRLAFVIACFWGHMPLLLSQGFQGGLLGGANLCQVDGDRNAGFNKLGLNGGVFVHYLLEKPENALGFDLLYMKKGSRSHRDDPSVWLYHYHYIEVPLYYMRRFETFDLRAGLNWSYVFNAKFDDGGSDKPIPGLKNTNILYELGFQYHFNPKLSLYMAWQNSVNSIIDPNLNPINLPFQNLRRNGFYHNLIRVSALIYLTK